MARAQTCASLAACGWRRLSRRATARASAAPCRSSEGSPYPSTAPLRTKPTARARALRSSETSALLRRAASVSSPTARRPAARRRPLLQRVWRRAPTRRPRRACRSSGAAWPVWPPRRLSPSRPLSAVASWRLYGADRGAARSRASAHTSARARAHRAAVASAASRPGGRDDSDRKCRTPIGRAVFDSSADQHMTCGTRDRTRHTKRVRRPGKMNKMNNSSDTTVQHIEIQANFTEIKSSSRRLRKYSVQNAYEKLS